MAARDTDTGLPDAPAYMLPGVRLFASGVYRDRRWEPSDIREMARNARLLGPDGMKLFLPSAIPGHEDDDGWREHVDPTLGGGEPRTDAPAAGWVDPATVRAVPDPDNPGEMILKGAVVNVPPDMAQKIHSGKYKFGSSEIYDDFQDDFGRSLGKTLRRFSYLGAEPPQVKRLGQLPRPVPMPALRQFSERSGVRIRERLVRHGDLVHTYAETTVMDRNAMTTAIQAAMPKLSKATLDAMSDDQLMDLLNSLPASNNPTPTGDASAAPAAAMADDDQTASTPTADSQTDPGAPSRDEMVQALTAAGVITPDDADTYSDDELAAMLDELDNPTDGVTGPTDGTGAGSDSAPSSYAEPGDRDGMIAELVDAGQDASALQGMSDDDLAKLYQQLIGGAAASPPPAAAMSAADGLIRKGSTVLRPRMPGERIMGSDGNYHAEKGTSMTRCSERPAPPARQAARVRRTMDEITRLSERQLDRLRKHEAERKQQVATTFCEKLVREGKATPAQVKALHMPLLLALDDLNPVHKFTENGRTTRLSAFELKVKELDKLPAIFHMGERFRGLAAAETSDETEAAKVREFATTLTDNALRAGNYRDREDFVAKFSEARKKEPGLTASKYLGAGALD